MISAKRILVCVCLVMAPLFTSPALGGEANETPTWYYGWEIMPYLFHLQDRPEMKVAAENQGYVISDHYNLAASFYPDPLVTDVEGEYGNMAGVGLINTHGSTSGQAIEVYPWSGAGKAARDTALAWYERNGYSGDLYASQIDNQGYHISVRYSAISSWSSTANALIHNQVCYGGNYAVWNGARVWFGPAQSCSVAQSKANVKQLWEGLDGIRGKAKRVAGQAYLDAPSLTRGGNDSTTLAPTIGAYGPAENSDVDNEGVPGWAVFDSRMDMSVSAAGIIHGDGNLLVEGERWRSGERDTLKYKLRAMVEGEGCIHITEDAVSVNIWGDGRPIDGNQDPPGSDGLGPNGDEFVICYYCTETDPNYAARLASSWAYRAGDDVMVGWHADAQINTSKFVVDGSEGEAWKTVGEVAFGDVIAPNVYQVRVEGGHEYYRIVEMDATGRRCDFRRVAVEPYEPAFVSEIVRLAPRFDYRSTGEAAMETECRTSTTGPVPGPRISEGGIPDWVFFGPDSLLAECMPAIDWFELNGIAVDTVHAPSPDQ